MLGGLLLAPVLIVHILIEHLIYAWKVITCPCSCRSSNTSDLICLVIVHILVEHLMYAWWVITCPCSNSAHIGRTSDVCLVGYYLPLF